MFPQFSGSPTSFQFAKEGEWENAWAFSAAQGPRPDALRDYLGDSTEVAFEAFFMGSFFGARMTGSTLELEAFCGKCLNAVRAGTSFFDCFEKTLGLPVRHQHPSFAEIGCVNAWRSIGTVRISSEQLISPDLQTLWQSALNSTVGQDNRHAKAIEFAFDRPLPHWFGVAISSADAPNRLSQAMLFQSILALEKTAKKHRQFFNDSAQRRH